VRTLDELAPEPLMKTLGVIVLNEFLDQMAPMSLAEYHVRMQGDRVVAATLE